MERNMTRYRQGSLALFIIIAFFLHLIVFTSLILPDYHRLADFERSMKRSLAGARDIIVNINQDDQRQVTEKTLLSERDSTARGYITRERGDRWLNNSLDFSMLKGSAGMTGADASSSGRRADERFILSRMSEVVMGIRYLKTPAVIAGGEGKENRILIPDKNDINMNNALYYSNTGMFSFNTAKFKNFAYFKAMKDRVASHWYPPVMANAVFGGYNPTTGGYAPGHMRIMAIPSQQVKIVFTMNRKGDIQDVYLVDSLGNEALDTSCMDAIRLSRSFGPVPDDIPGDVVAIPFIFGYYVY